MRLLRKKHSVIKQAEDKDPKIAALENAVDKNRIAKVAVEELEAAKDDLKQNVFPFGEPTGETSWKFKFPADDPKYANVAVTYTERTKPYLDIDAATRILKEKRLFQKCLSTPEPPPPPPPFIDEEKIMQYFSEGKLTNSEIRKMIKVSKKDIVKAITITEPDGKKGGKAKSNKKR